ncbi:hypothetical protein BHM03_00042615 [Ensete ventricosum]|nr:hypothetical protein BHM03_00042615 [Ensete ventricosum]
MVASVAAAFFPVPSSSSTVLAQASKSIGDGPRSLGIQGIVAKPNSSSGAMEIKAQAQTLPKINGTKVELKTKEHKADEEDVASVPRTFYNQLPDWSFLFAAITTIFLAAEKQLTLLDWKPKRPDMLADAFGLGKIVQDGMVFRQNFSIRSYEIGVDRTASIETLMNHLQVVTSSFFCLLLQSAPITILEDHQLASMTLEYRRECGRDSVLQSLTAISTSPDGIPSNGIECQHLLQLECGAEIVRGRTEWRPKHKHANGPGNMGANSSS